jgi:hypothetical protein
MRCLKSFGERIAARDPDRQTAEIHIRKALMNRFPAHLVIDDGAFQPPYKNAAFRAEAAWHRDALHDITERLSAAI